MKDLLLSQFHPKTELILPQHEITKPKYPVIDFHCHFFLDIMSKPNDYNLEDEKRKLSNNGVAAIINLIIAYTSSEEIVYKVLDYTKDDLDVFVPFGTVDTSKVADTDFATYAYDTICKQHNLGVKGLKFLKDVSLNYKDKEGNRIRTDDERLNPIWETAAKFKMPVLIHIADPCAFFKPINSENERYDELTNHPDWSFYGDKFFEFEELMQMQENLLANNPETTFVLAHFGNYSENLAYVSRLLDLYPNAYIDIAARINDLGRQPYTSREFFIKYQDRIVFGTDSFPKSKVLPYYYRFLETFDEYFDYEPEPECGRWKIYGICLPDDVLKKIYHENAIKLVPSLVNIIKDYK